MPLRLALAALLPLLGCVPRPPIATLRGYDGAPRHFSMLAMSATGQPSAASATAVTELTTNEVVVAGWLQPGDGVPGEFELAPRVPVGFVARVTPRGLTEWRVPVRSCEPTLRLSAGDDDQIYLGSFGVLGLSDAAGLAPFDIAARCANETASVVKLSGLGSVVWQVPVPFSAPPLVSSTASLVVAAGPLRGSALSAVVALSPDGTEVWRREWPGEVSDVEALGDGRVAVAFNGVVPDRRCAVQAFDAASGAPRWTQELPPTLGRCRAQALEVSGNFLVLQSTDVADDGSETPMVSSFEAKTGALHFTQPLKAHDDHEPARTAAVLVSVQRVPGGSQPLVLAVDGESGRTTLLDSPDAEALPLKRGPFPSVVEPIAVSRGPDAAFVAGAFLGRIRFWGRLFESPYEARAPHEASRSLYVVRIPLP